MEKLSSGGGMGCKETKLLIVENDLDDYYIVTSLLNKDRKRQYKIKQVSGLSDAVTLLEKEYFDVILLDLGLEDSSGLQTLRELTAVVENIPIVVLTGVDDETFGQQAIQLGAEDYISKSALEASLLTRIIAYAIERHRLLVKIKRQAEEDPLTSLPNRTYLCDTLETLIKQSERNQAKVAVALMDLDGFKQVNDSYGHHAGDRLLQEISIRLQQRLRKSDVVGRWGGDEFVLLITNYNDPESLKELLEMKQQFLSESYYLSIDGQEKKIDIGVSIGVAEWKPGFTLSKLIDLADQRMYIGKNSGKSQIVCSD